MGIKSINYAVTREPALPYVAETNYGDGSVVILVAGQEGAGIHIGFVIQSEDSDFRVGEQLKFSSEDSAFTHRAATIEFN